MCLYCQDDNPCQDGFVSQLDSKRTERQDWPSGYQDSLKSVLSKIVNFGIKKNRNVDANIWKIPHYKSVEKVVLGKHSCCNRWLNWNLIFSSHDKYQYRCTYEARTSKWLEENRENIFKRTAQWFCKQETVLIVKDKNNKFDYNKCKDFCKRKRENEFKFGGSIYTLIFRI